MLPEYQIHDTTRIFTPALIFYKKLIEQNIAHAVDMAGGPERLRPHVKTHKTREIVALELAAGITKHKCATIAEAEMLADVGVRDVLLAYNIVGPNCRRMAKLVMAYPACRFSVLADHADAVQALSSAMKAVGRDVDVFLDVDVGQQRTGIHAGAAAVELYALISGLPGLRAGGLHVYDGHTHQEDLDERRASVEQQLEPVLAMRDQLEKRGLSVPHLVVGGTPTFPVYVGMELPGMEFSPGTCILHDHGYGTRFREMSGFTPAALLLTRVISRPTATRITFDLGYKAVASDPPAGKRLVLLNLANYEAVLQNEEHLVVETPEADRFRPGDEAYAMPTHICPTCAMHRQAHVVEDGKVVDSWEIVARDRMLTI